jgi:hypothetical protein
VPPETTITSGPTEGSTITSPTPNFAFSSDQASAGFQCAVDGAAFSGCRSGDSIGPLAHGAHSFQVRARVGTVRDATPATRSFSVGDVAIEPPPPGGGTDITAPDTTILKKPKKKSTKRKATIEFTSTEPGSTFECKLDKDKLKSCSSPYKAKKLKPGKHTFSVTATDAAGNADPSPAVVTWKVKRKKR